MTAYRKHCASSSSPGQLILPESFKLYPLYALSLLKNTAFRLDAGLSSDDRVYWMRRIKGMNLKESTAMLYPRLLSLSAFDSDHATFAENGRFKYPQLIRTSIDRFDPGQIYLIGIFQF